MSRLLSSPWLLSAFVAIGLGLGSVSSQEKKTDPDPLPFPRVVGEPKKAKLAEPPKTSKEDDPKVVEPKKEIKKDEPKDEPKKELTFEKVTSKVAPEPEKKEEPKAEEKKEEEKKDPLTEVKSSAEKGVADADVALQHGDNAWMLACSALVLLMTPGLALFYGGMVRRKNVLATMMQSYASMAIVGLYWVAFGYGLAFGPSIITIDALGVKDGGIVGWSWDLFFLKGIEPQALLPGYKIPVYTHVMFQGMFAIITPALISGALAERIRFWPWTIFMLLWVTLVYCPLAHMVWAWDWFYIDPVTAGKDLGGTPIGFLGKLGALDFAGGTVVHIAAGFAGLACIIALKKRTGYPKQAMHPNGMVLTLIGAGLLWFGWFGFNGGSGLGAGDLGSTGFATTQAAAAAAGLSWILIEWIFKGKPTALGLASGIVAGLVAVTPASGYVYPWGGAAIGFIAGIVCYFAVQMKSMLGYDDSLDAFGVHGIGGFLGAVLTGVFCYGAIWAGSADGYFAHTGLPKNVENLKKEAESLRKDITAIETGKAAAEKKIDDELAAEIKDAKTDKEKTTLTEAADTAKAEIGKKIDRRKAKIDAIESKKVESEPDSKDGSIALLETKIADRKEAGKGATSQLKIQLIASVISAVFAFVISLILAFLVQAMTLGNFRTSLRDETEGLDYTEHGETGLDLVGVDTVSSSNVSEPKAAKVPPGGKRFGVIVEGIENGGLMHAWSQLCQPSDAPTDPDFKAVYPYVTTVQGNHFRLRGGDPKVVAASIQKLFQKKLGKPVKVRIED